MRVAVVGAGFTGLSAAVELVDSGHEVEVFEVEKQVGGLAIGYKKDNWKSSLEIFYHHIFSNDKEIIEMSKKVGLPPTFYDPVTSSLVNGKIFRLDSPISVLKFSPLSIFSRLHMGLGLFILKIIPNGLFLEKFQAIKMLPILIGREAYKVVWEKLLKAKFGTKMKTVNMAWFWSRVAKRTKTLGYFEGGFLALAVKMKEYIEKRGGKIYLNQSFKLSKKTLSKYDKIIITTPAPIASKITKTKLLPKIDYLWAQTLILNSKMSIINEYWLNILEENYPFLVAVEHTNMIERSNYANNTILYLGNYLEDNNPQLKMTKDELLELYLPYIKKINSSFDKKSIISIDLFRKPYSQPVFPVNYSRQLAKISQVKGKILFANMSLVYPFDRGTNYAVKMGVEIARKCLV